MAKKQFCLKFSSCAFGIDMKKLKVLILFLIIIPAGCNNLSTVSLVESQSPEMQGDKPVSTRYIPSSRLDMILNETMGSDNEILFASDDQKETFVAFDPNTNEPVKMAQVRKIANSKGSAVVFVGLDTSHNPESIVKTYSYEVNKNMPGYNLYTIGKEKFLRQFQNRPASDAVDHIDGVTGATPVWKPISEQIGEIAADLVQLKHNSEFLNFMQTQGKKWQPDSTIEAGPETVMYIEDEVPAESDGDLLFAHWKLIGMAEMSLMTAGLLIIAIAGLKRRQG